MRRSKNNHDHGSRTHSRILPRCGRNRVIGESRRLAKHVTKTGPRLSTISWSRTRDNFLDCWVWINFGLELPHFCAAAIFHCAMLGSLHETTFLTYFARNCCQQTRPPHLRDGRHTKLAFQSSPVLWPCSFAACVVGALSQLQPQAHSIFTIHASTTIYTSSFRPCV